MFKKLLGIIKPVPGSGIGTEIAEVKKAWNEGKKVKGIVRIATYLGGALLLWYLIKQGIVTTLPEVLEYLKVVL